MEHSLDPEGQLLDRRAAHGLDLRALYKRLVAARLLDLRLSRLGLPMWVSSAGEEAATVLSATLAGPEDWLYPSVRDLALAPIRGMDVDEFATQVLGGAYNGRPGAIAAADLGIGHAPETLGLHLPLAAGQAHAQKLAGTGRMTAALFGEGLTTTSMFHEAVALAVALLVLGASYAPDVLVGLPLVAGWAAGVAALVLIGAVAGLKPGTSAPLGVLRKDKKTEIAVVPGTRQRPKIQR